MQRPCYLLVGEGYADSFRALMEETDWDRYGVGNNAKCAKCQVHCGFEPTAVADTVKRPWAALRVALRGPRTEGAFAPDPLVTPEVRKRGRTPAAESLVRASRAE